MYSNLALNEYDPFEKNSLLDECMEGLVNRNKDSLILLYELTKNVVYGLILSIVKNKHDAEDILQEVYIKVYLNAEKYEKKGKPLAWIVTITKNLCYEHLRKSKDNVDIDEMHDIGFNDKKNKNVEDKIILNIAFKQISDEERKIIVLHVVGGLKYREIAKILDLPLATVLSKYHRAIRRMKELLKEEMK